MAEVKNYGLSGVHRTLQLGKQGPVLVGNADTDSFTVTLQDASTLTTMGGANATSGTHFITKSQLDSVYTEAQFLANVSYNDSSPILLGNISSGTKTIITTFTVSTAFDANAVVTIGDSSNNSLLMSDNYCEIEATGVYQTINTVEFASNTSLNIYVTRGGASAGIGNVLVSVVDGPVVNAGAINYGAGSGGISLTDLSVTSNSPSGNGSLTYNNSTGVFTFTPADANAGGIGLTALSVTSNSPSGNGSLSYNNSTGVFTFTPANLSSVVSNYGNSNVTTLLSSFGSNTISTTGNISVGNISATGITKAEQIHEIFTTKTSATGTVTHDCSTGQVFSHSSISANFTANFTNLNLDSGYATTITLVLNQGGTAHIPNAVQIGGVGQTINWQGGSAPTGNANKKDVASFSILNSSGTYTVLGQLTTFG